LDGVDSIDNLEKITIPGNTPYVEPVNLGMIKQARAVVSLTPETDMDKCGQCGLCAEVCPANAIDPDDVSQINKWECMICFACIKFCPNQAKQMTDPNFNGAIGQLQAACQIRKEPELFL
jgi:ferredoxin